MKGNNLSSTNRTVLKKANRQSTFAMNQESYLASKERQKSLRMQAEKAELERRKRDVLPELIVPVTDSQPGDSGGESLS
ncbi:MAG: hypothetical protein H7301_12260 [Cryobacterium sp.]|nr:hypothetical protein [Oligoflexia bacterium]